MSVFTTVQPFASVTVTEPAQLTVLATVESNINCFGGSNGAATVNAFGGTAPYSYTWNTVPVSNNQTIANLIAGTYIVTVTDANNCLQRDTIIITQPTQLVIDSLVSTNVTCKFANDGTAAVFVSGATPPYSYSWSNGATTSAIANLIAGNYTVTVSDSLGCTVSSSTTIIEPELLSIDSFSVTNVQCLGGSNGTVTLNVSGGTPPFSYLWSNNATTPTVTGLAAGWYYVLVTDASNCTKFDSVRITEPITRPIADAGPDKIICKGRGGVMLEGTVANGTNCTYQWFPTTGLSNP
ncbi:MAG: SprB repeat-containing protein, partial [Bacteroidia bacterium]|nr:SprB repeat-containing protein [Bacteroidia bacterium]